MKVVVLANKRYHCLSPSWYRLLDDQIVASLVYSEKQWWITDGETWIALPDKETGAVLLAKELNRIAANGS